MMGQAQEKADRLHLKNVTFRQGDVGALPYADSVFDIVLSLNGFHAFPDKEAAYREVFRVLKPGGTFCGCFYVMGEQKRTDWLVRHVYEKAGFFTPPYETVSSLKACLLYTSGDLRVLRLPEYSVQCAVFAEHIVDGRHSRHEADLGLSLIHIW